jgi:hypothetical protein
VCKKKCKKTKKKKEAKYKYCVSNPLILEPFDVHGLFDRYTYWLKYILRSIRYTYGEKKNKEALEIWGEAKSFFCIINM